MVTVRNRCLRPAHFLVGPEVSAPPDGPVNEIAPGEAWVVDIGSSERLYFLSDRNGTLLATAHAKSRVVFLGEPSCEKIYAD